jgi:hypothetical protein
MPRRLLVPALLLAALAAEARAHFPWIRLESGADRTQRARVVFNELPEVGEPDLSAKVAKLALQADGRPLGALAPADGGGLAVDLGDRAPAVVEGSIDYGVLARDGQPPFLLVYSARAQARPEPAPASRPDLALVWVESGARPVVRATWRGAPLADLAVRVLPDEAEEAEVRTDADGRATLPALATAGAALLVKHVEPRAGEHDGKPFREVRHYATLTIAGTPAAPSADDVLQAAHDARACWGPNFPGFGAAIAVNFGGDSVTGRLDVAPDGALTLDLPEGPARDWARSQLRSLVMHRGLDGPTTLDPGATFAEPETVHHPLGRLIRLGDDAMGSHYRIAGDEIREVNRDAGPVRFSNRVLAVTRNAEGKVLPGSYTVTYRDRQTDALVRVETFHDTWTRVGRLDLPATHTQINAAADAKAPEVRQLVLSDHRLKPTTEAASR